MSFHVRTFFVLLELTLTIDPGPYPNEPYIDYSGGLAQLAITNHGSDWYWAVCAVMILSTIIFLGLSLTKRREHRVFHYITAAITMVASIAYFSMGSGLGWGKRLFASTILVADHLLTFPFTAPIVIEFVRPSMGGGALTREIFYVRYIDWLVAVYVGGRNDSNASIGSSPHHSCSWTFFSLPVSHGLLFCSSLSSTKS